MLASLKSGEQGNGYKGNDDLRWLRDRDSPQPRAPANLSSKRHVDALRALRRGSETDRRGDAGAIQRAERLLRSIVYEALDRKPPAMALP